MYASFSSSCRASHPPPAESHIPHQDIERVLREICVNLSCNLSIHSIWYVKATNLKPLPFVIPQINDFGVDVSFFLASLTACVHNLKFSCSPLCGPHTLSLVIHMAFHCLFRLWEALVDVLHSEQWPTGKVPFPHSPHPCSSCWKTSTSVKVSDGLLSGREVKHIAD